MIRKMKELVGARTGLKLVLALFGVISAVMIVGTVFMARVFTENLYHQMETRGKELGLFLGRACTDFILSKDVVKLDNLVSEAAKSQDVIYIYIADPSYKIVNSVRAGFNMENREVKELFVKEPSEEATALAANVGKRMDVLVTKTDIILQGARLGTVTMGFSQARAKKEMRDIIWILLATSAAVICAVSALIYVMVQKMMVLPLTAAAAAASNIAAGDLTQSVRVHSMDEFGMLGRGLNRMTVGLKGMIGNVQGATTSVGAISGEVKDLAARITEGSRVQAESVEEAASSVNEMHFTLQEIAGTVADLYSTSEHTSSSAIETSSSIDEVARTMSELSGSIEDTSLAITQLSSAVRQIAENVEILSSAAEETAASTAEISASVKEVEANAKQSVSLAEAVAADAERLGMRSIEKTIEGMGRIESNARQTAEVVNRLGERAESIGSILTVIEDITDQTGLLALNAAILAAQAGEHGKGFAVVATEIRELANRTASSTKEIGQLITSVQEESREAVEAMKQGVGIVEEGTRLSADAGLALRKILERADQSRDMSRSINKAAVEQARGIKQVSEAVYKISEMTHQIAKAVQEQKSGSDQIARASDKMREITRFVKKSTEEQASGSREITSAVETMSAKIGMVNRAAGEVRAGSDLIVKAIDRIKTIARENAERAAGLNTSVDVMAGQTALLKKELERFKT